MGDHMWMSRYIMYRICELYNVECSIDPKPIAGGACVWKRWAGGGFACACTTFFWG